MNHEILLRKLQNYGIRGIPLKWFNSYLSNRNTFIEINSLKSEEIPINIGVPQGSILGPILFLLYVNNIPEISSFFRTQLFADDTIVSTSGPDFNILKTSTNTELMKLSNWTFANKLTLNASKTEFLVFSNRHYEKNDANLNLLGNIVHSSQTCKYLGVYLDRDMSFKSHIDHVLKKVSRHTGILYKIRDDLPITARLDFYYAYIYPYLSYNIIVWGAAYDSVLQPLFLQQKRTVRTVAGAGYRDHTDPLFRRYGTLKLIDIYKLQLLSHMHKPMIA